MRLFLYIALKHILSRKRQSLVSLFGIIIGVAFFLTISSLMQGSETDFIKRLVDNSPHITVTDTYRNPKRQPVEELYPGAIVDVLKVKPETETRGIRGYKQILETLRREPGMRAAAVLTGQAILSFAGRDISVTLNGIDPNEMRNVTTIDEHMIAGSVDALIANRDGIIVGAELMRTQSLVMGDNITLAASTGQVRTFKIVGEFRTGRADYDQSQGFVDIKRVQAMMNRPDRANNILIKLADPKTARTFAAQLENRIGYKAVSWQEASEDIMSLLLVRNIIMYSVVSAVLIVAAFGIYNIISTNVMEKLRDIAILKSMGFRSGDIQWIFLIQGALLGLAGIVTGLPLGCVFMYALMQLHFKPPGVSEAVQMPLDWTLPQFLIAGAFAFFAAVFASYLPARKGSKVLPVDILRGAM